MRLVYIIFPLAACVSCSVSKNGVNNNPGATKGLFANNIVVAHSGGLKKDNLPQNSIAFLKENIKQKDTGSKADVRMTADDSLIINTHAAGWKLVWSDEFNYNGLPDSSKWSFETGGNGWGNNELEYYTEKDTSNAIVKDGHLMIIARKQHKENREYTSARLVTKNKADFKYGRIEVRAKVPAAAGTWPAIWMLGTNIEAVSYTHL